MKQFDIIVIGSGAGGKVTRTAARLGYKVEVIESIADALSNEEFIGYLKGNIMKYLLRAGKKRGSAATEDMGKATWYISRLQRRLFTIEHENRKSKDR